LLGQTHERQRFTNRERRWVPQAKQLHGLSDGEETIDCCVLENDPDALPILTLTSPGIEPKNLHEARVPTTKALENLDRRGLASAIRPKQRKDFAFRDLETDASYSRDATVRLAKVLYLDSRHDGVPAER
jgi:hypothetical protein